MIGEMKIEVNGKEHTIRADWRSGQLIAERVADPFTIMTEFAKAEFGDQTGLVRYEPKIKFDLTSSVKIIHAGLEAAGHDLSLDDVGNGFIGEKLPDAINMAIEYIAMFCQGAEEMPGKDEGGKKPKVDGGSS